jgi:hypothetical protein
MNHIRRYSVSALVITGTLVSTSASARQAAPAAPGDVKAALVRDVGNLSDKFTGLARVMAGKYDWKPGQGVRSVGDVFNLIVTENNMLASLIATGKGGMAGGAAITDPAAMQTALTSSYASVSKALSALSATDLNASIMLFGQNTTKQGAVLMLLFDQHEHLGQSIAYARTNSVVPPWSK